MVMYTRASIGNGSCINYVLMALWSSNDTYFGRPKAFLDDGNLLVHHFIYPNPPPSQLWPPNLRVTIHYSFDYHKMEVMWRETETKTEFGGEKEKEREETVLRIKKHFVGLASEETILPHVAINVDHYKFLVSLLSLMHGFFWIFSYIFNFRPIY